MFQALHSVININETYIHIKNYKQMFPSALFAIANTGNNPNVYKQMNG